MLCSLLLGNVKEKPDNLAVRFLTAGYSRALAAVLKFHYVALAAFVGLTRTSTISATLHGADWAIW